MGGNWGSVMKQAARLVKKDGYILTVMMLTVPLAGELKFYPLNETFRVSFGVPTFFLSFVAAAECPGCAVRLFNGSGRRRVSGAA